MADTSLKIGGGKWAVKEDSLLGYNVIQNKYVPIEMDTVRATTATRVNENGLIETVPKNLLTYSEQFDNGSWVKTRATVTSNATTSPDGTITADKLIPSVDNNTHILEKAGLTVTAQIYTATLYAKKAEYDTIRIAMSNYWAPVPQASFNLTTKTTFNVSAATAVITELSDGWFKLNVIATVNPLAGGNGKLLIYAGNDGELILTGDGTSGVYIWGAQLEAGSTATSYFPTTTRLNIPRIDYTSGQGAILVEPQRTNLALYSEQFDNAAWVKDGINVTSNNTIAPDGNLTADKIVENNTAGLHRMYAISSCSASTTYTASIFVKKSERTRFEFLETTLGGCVFDLTNGTIVSGTDGFIESYNNDWYRCGIKRTTSVSQSVFVIQVRLIISGTNNNYLGDGTSGVFIWGAQLEAGSYPTSYIPTVASTVTRNADVISKTGISDVLLSNGYSIFIHIEVDSVSVYSQFQFRESTLNYILRVGNQIKVANAVAINNTLGFNKIMVSVLSNGNYTLYKNGLSIQSGTGVTANLSQINTDAGYKIKNIQVFPTALTDQECINLTTL